MHRRGRVGSVGFSFACGAIISAMGLSVAHGSEPAAPAPIIEWYLIDLPPVQIATGSLRGKGYTDRMRWRLIAGLSNYRHRLKLANVQRIVADIKTKPNICNPAFLRTPEREQFMEFAEPTHAQFSNGAVVLRQRMNSLERYITPEGELQVDAMLDAGSHLAVQSGRSYGAELDGLAEKARKGNHLVVLSSTRPVEAKLGLLEKGRVDAAFLYPIELELTLRHTGQQNLYEFLPVAGNGSYTLNYLACSKSPLGKQVVEEANAIIIRERDGFFASAYREWLPAGNLKMHGAFHQGAFKQPLRNVATSKSDQLLDDAIAACLLEGGMWHKHACDTNPERSID